ncbi:pericentrin [Perkinsela sp. CCAP 1560/4]|nr:pericentrin [Perkinsela sp. CCAP 1560/4]|eukprot:KNH04045.1 pericentrin [Perkinsela sp. CCAP 1560/4]
MRLRPVFLFVIISIILGNLDFLHVGNWIRERITTKVSQNAFTRWVGRDYPKADVQKNQQITELEKSSQRILDEDILRQRAIVDQHEASYKSVKARMPFFPSAADRAELGKYESTFREAQTNLSALEARHQGLLRQLKQLHGIRSMAFYEEQKQSIRQAMRQLHQTSYDNAWWSTLLSGKSDSIKDLIVNFFVEWMYTFILMFPFTVAYFLLWRTPMTIWQYSSAPSDILLGTVAWMVSAIAFVLPIAIFLFLLRFVLLKNSGKRKAV